MKEQDLTATMRRRSAEVAPFAGAWIETYNCTNVELKYAAYQR